jgi:hypothetical protein
VGCEASHTLGHPIVVKSAYQFMTNSNQYVAVAVVPFLSEIKRHLVLFDKVAVVYGTQDWHFRKKDPSLAADLDWLENKDLVFRTEEFLKRECGFEILFDRTANRGKRLIVNVLDEGKMPLSKLQELREVHMGKEFLSKFQGKTIGHIMDSMQDMSCRWEAQRIARELRVQTVSLSSPHPEVSELLGVDTSPGNVVRVVLKDMPEPSDTTSLEEILEFRQDPESAKKMFAFRRWIKTMMSKDLPPTEISEELEWLEHQYEEHMRFHHMKIKKGVLQIVVTAAGEVSEDLIKLRFGKLSKALFSMSQKNIELMEAEMNAPGREIAYIVNARKRFG